MTFVISRASFVYMLYDTVQLLYDFFCIVIDTNQLLFTYFFWCYSPFCSLIFHSCYFIFLLQPKTMSQLHNVVAKMSQRPRHSIDVHKVRNNRRISPIFDKNGRPSFENVASNESEMTPGKLPTNMTRKVFPMMSQIIFS